MLLAASNIAWPPIHRHMAYRLMQEAGFSGLEIAPGLLFPDLENPFEPSSADRSRVRTELEAAGLELVSMQSLLFGRRNAALFGANDALHGFVAGMEAAIALAGELGIVNLVFGSPAQRVIPDGMDTESALKRAVDVFLRLGDKAQSTSCRIAIEPNPSAYNTNFLNTLPDAAEFVRRVAHPAITLNLDTGAMMMTGHFDGFDLADHADIVSHVHVSEPMLAPAPSSSDMALRIVSALKDMNWQGSVSIEMKAVSDDDDLEVFRACVNRLALAWESVL